MHFFAFDCLNMHTLHVNIVIAKPERSLLQLYTRMEQNKKAVTIW